MRVVSKRKKIKRKITKKQRQRQKGGNQCPDEEVKCDLLDTFYNNTNSNLKNQMWKTCIYQNNRNNHILYITPLNVVIKSIETAQIPEFNVSFLTEQNKMRKPIEFIRCKIMIENKFVASFLKICDEWYAMVRLFGVTLNTGILARTEKNRVFYKIKKDKLRFGNVNENGLIYFSQGSYTQETRNNYWLITGNTPIIIIKDDCFENIVKTNDVFYVLQRFRQEKLIGHEMKEKFIEKLIKGVINGI